MSVRYLISIIAVVLLVVGGIWYVVVITPRSAPWEESGTLVLVTRTVPEPSRSAATLLGLGLANMRLLEEGGAVRLALTTQRVLLDVQDARPYELLRTEVGTGEYQGLAFTLKSPEFRNDWQGDTPPEHLSLVSGEVFLDTPFTVETGKTTVILLGFETLRAVRNRDEALLYLPVIHAEVRTDATVEPGEASSVVVRDGTIVHNIIFGMDWDGTMRKNFRASLEAVPKTLEESSVPPVPTLEEQAPITEPQDEENASTSVSTSTATSLTEETP